MSAQLDTPEATGARAARLPRPAAFFLMAPTRRLGPLTRDELVGYYHAGMVGADAQIVGPDWDGAFSAAAAAEWLGIALRGPVAVAAVVPEGPRVVLAPPAPAPIGYHRAGLGWRVTALWLVVLLAVQMAIVPARSIAGQADFAGFVGAVAWRFAAVALPCWLIVAGVHRLARGLWPSARGPLFAISAVYVVLAVQFLLQPPAPAPAPAPVVGAMPAAPIAVAPIAAEDAAFAAWERDAFAEREAASEASTFPEASASKTPMASAAKTTPQASATSTRPARAARVDADPMRTTARALFDARDWQGLVDHATTWTRQDPERATAWMYLGLGHEYLQQFEQARAANSRAHELDADDAYITRNLAISLTNLGRYREVTALLEPVLKRDPGDYRAFNGYGYAMAQVGEFDEAVAALERAIEIEPGYTLAWKNLSDAYQRAGYLDKANQITRRANARR